tara:strand:- start:196 stop:666 length:471 start_codon:yes stop_codon:yes gene_type:complete
MTKQQIQIITKNKKAYFSYTISSVFLCGIKLYGSEIKSIRDGQVNISESYCILSNNEIWIKNMDIARYKFFNTEEYNPTRLRKLLLNKIEIQKIKKQLNEKGMTLIPTKLIINPKGLAKLEVGLGKGKKIYDKRESLKKRDAKIEMDRKKRENKSP